MNHFVAAAFHDELEKISAKVWTAKGLHRHLGSYGVPRAEWDNNEAFMVWTERLVGKKHLDDMTPKELERVAIAISRKYKPKKVKKFAGASPEKIPLAKLRFIASTG